MNKETQEQLNNQTHNRHMLLHIIAGFKELVRHKWKLVFLLLYAVIISLIWSNRMGIFRIDSTLPFFSIFQTVLNTILPCAFLMCFILVIAYIGIPLGSKATEQNFRRIGFTNKADEAPILLAKYKSNLNDKVTVMEFFSCGIPKEEWVKQCARIESALNLQIADIKTGKDLRTIVLQTVSPKYALPPVIKWKDEYLKDNSFELVLGESLLGQETINLNDIPHVLIGGATQSGKSQLLKLLLMQCIKKNAEVFIADFKGGVDFPPVWHKKCQIVTDKEQLLHILNKIMDIAEKRKQLFTNLENDDLHSANIEEYIRKTGNTLTRIIFAFDEVAEVLSTSAHNNEDKIITEEIINKISTIVRLYRAFGIHLILSTQRPDANVLEGQIKSNMDMRICGRADSILSKIILDNPDAATKIPKDSKGRFLTNTNTVFQSYLFDERNSF